MTVKESYDLVGSPTTWGDPALENNVPQTNAVVVQRLLDAGAVIFGKTNVPLDLADWQSFNAIYGTTNNPWNPELTPGGSSGGAAAALAAGLTGLEAGSDIGASIRNPAHYCGVFGHKPTFGIVPGRGQAKPGALTMPDIAAVGPLARSAKDLELELDVVAGPDILPTRAWRLELPPPRQTALKDFRVAVMLSDPVAEVDQPYQDCLQNVADELAKAGALVNDTARPNLDAARAFEVYVMLLRAATSPAASAEKLAFFEQVKSETAADDPSYVARMARAALLPHRQWLAWNNEREAMRYQWAAFFED
jgi:amidase